MLQSDRLETMTFCFFRTNQLVSPSGRDVAQRQRGLAPSLRELDLPQAKTEGVLPDWQNTHEIRPNTDLPVCCSFRHGLRRATFLREEGFGFPRNPTCLSLWERCRAATERAGSFFEGAGLPPCGKTEGVLQISKIRMRFSLTRISPRKKRPAG